jgi:hypothetical protein
MPNTRLTRVLGNCLSPWDHRNSGHGMPSCDALTSSTLYRLSLFTNANEDAVDTLNRTFLPRRRKDNVSLIILTNRNFTCPLFPGNAPFCPDPFLSLFCVIHREPSSSTRYNNNSSTLARSCPGTLSSNTYPALILFCPVATSSSLLRSRFEAADSHLKCSDERECAIKYTRMTKES